MIIAGAMTDEEALVKEILEGQDHASLALAYDEARRIVDAQFAHSDALEVKASILLGFAGVLLTLFLTVIPDKIRYFDLGTTILLLGLYGTAIASVVCAFIAIQPRVYQNVPSIRRMLERYLGWEEADAKFQLLYELRNVFDENIKVNGQKLKYVKLSLWSLEACGAIGILTFLHQVWLYFLLEGHR
jgi:hypothetical protein